MNVVHPVCAGIDVHKRDIKVCLIRRDAQDQRQACVRTFRTMTADLLQMHDWLQSEHCPAVALESTGVYWRPVYNLLEGDFQVLLVNPTRIKHVPGRKTDVKDCAWIAELHEHGLLSGSFIPPVAIRDLRDLTRYRRRLVEMRTAEGNRLSKVLEQANIKLASVASEVLGVSSRAMLAALVSGEQDPVVLAELSKGRLRNKRADLQAALVGRFRPHHAQLIGALLVHIEFLDEQISQAEGRIDELCQSFEPHIAWLDTVPGINRRAAQAIIAEIGVDMARFPSHKHLCGWAQLAPGNHESGGKRYSGRIGKGNQWLRATLVDCAHAAGHSSDTYLGAQYHRLARRKDKKRAAVAVAHSMLESIYFILRDHVPYKDLGPQHFDQIHQAQVIRYHVERLEQLGYKVEIQPVPTVAASTAAV